MKTPNSMNEALIDLVANYQADELDAAHKAEFEAKCAANPDFLTEVRQISQALAAVKAGRKAKMRTLLTAEVPAMEGPIHPAQKALRIAKYLAPVAAIAIIAIGLAGGFRKSRSPEYLYQEYFARPLSQDIVFDAGKQLWNEAMAYFYEAEYDSAAVSFETLLAHSDSTTSAGEDAKLYLAVTYLEQGSYDKAMAKLRAIGPQSTYFEAEAKWYTALTYLRMGNVVQARKMLEECLAIDNFYNKVAAKHLLRDLRRVKR